MDIVLAENAIIAILKIRPVKPKIEGARVAVDATIIWQENNEEDVLTIEEGEELTIFGDLTVGLHKRDKGVCWTAWLLLLAPIATWLGAFSWLYFNSLSAIVTC